MTETMNMIIQKSKLKKILTKGQKLTKKSSIQDYENLFIVNGTGWITNGDNFIEILEMFPYGSNISVNLKNLLNAIKSGNESIEIAINDNIDMVIDDGKNKYRLLSTKTNLNLIPEPIITPASINLSEDEISKVLIAASFTGRDYLREALMHVYINKKVYGTDAQMLYWSDFNVNGIESIESLLISSHSIEAMKNEEHVRITCDITQEEVKDGKEPHILYEFEEFNFYQKSTDFKYPNVEAVIPSEFKGRLLLHKENLLNAIEQTKYVWSTLESKRIDLSFCMVNNKLSISSSNIEENLEVKIEIDIEGFNLNDEFEISLNADFFKKCLDIQSDAILLQYQSASRCLVINDNVLLMPQLKY